MRSKRSAQSGTGTCVLMRRSMSAAEARFLPPNTPRHKHAVMLSTTLDTINMGQRFCPRGPNEGHKQQGGGPERGAMQTQTS